MSAPIDERRLLAGCDEQQIAAITSEAVPLLILAGAGSGKTRVLTRRIAWCVGTDVVTPAHVLALTFTRKAAGELRQRLTSIGLPTPVTAGTFHAVALAQLRRRALDRGRAAPMILESKARILAEVVPSRLELASTTKRKVDRREGLSLLAAEIEWSKARMVTPTHYAASIRQLGRESLFEPEFVEAVFGAYEREKQRRRVLDFDDLLVHLIDLLESDPEFAATQRWRFQYLFVDEFQDANTAQLRLLDAWLGDRKQLCAVGDPRQAIYGWNGADASGVLSFTEHYRDATVLELAANYRSSPQVVAVAATALGRGVTGPVATRPDGQVPSLSTYPDDEAEVAGVIAALRRAHGPGRRWSQCAILTRTNAQLRTFEEALESARIPYRSGGARTYLERPVIKRSLEQARRARNATAFSMWLASCDEDDEELTEEEAEELTTLAGLGREYLQLDDVPNGPGFLIFVRDALKSELAPGRNDAVDLVTFHRAKGLEWSVVFVTGLEDGFVPIAHAHTRQAIEEERRLLYVAMSRAEEELHCSWARSRTFGTRRVTRDPSPYLDPIEAACKVLRRAQESTPETAKRALSASREALGRPRTA